MNNQYEKSFPKMPISFQNRVVETLETLPEKKGNTMSIFNKKRFYLVAAAIVIMLATTAIAVGTDIFSIISHSGTEPNYTTVTQLSKVKKDIGIDPKIVETFSNGFSFSSGHITTSSGRDKDGITIINYKSLGLEYKNGNTTLFLDAFAEQFMFEDPTMKPVSSTTINDVEVKIFKYMTKYVPIDYVMTEEDKADEASGKYSFGTGDMIKQVEVNEMTFAIWSDSGIKYSLMGENTNLTNDELFTMVNEIITAK